MNLDTCTAILRWKWEWGESGVVVRVGWSESGVGVTVGRGGVGVRVGCREWGRSDDGVG